MKLVLFIVCVVLLTTACPKKQRPPIPPRPSPSPTASPTPAPSPTPTPWPTIQYDVASYLPPIPSGPTVTVNVEGLEAALNSDAGTVIVEGGGVVTKQMFIRGKRIIFRNDVFTEVPGLLESGVFMVQSGSRIEAENGAVIHGPNFAVGGIPATTVFETYDPMADVADPVTNAHFGKVENIAFINVTIAGREPTPFAQTGIRQTIALNNCHNCAVINSTISSAASIGIQIGGSSEKGHFAKRVLILNPRTDRVAAANIAMVNGEDVIIDGHRMTRPGRLTATGGPSGDDIETNTNSDRCSNLWVINGVYDFRDSEANGSAILAQNHQDHCSGLRILNNKAIGVGGTMTSGLFFTGTFRDALVANFEIVRSRQSGIQLYGTQDTTFQNIRLVNVGGGGLPAIYLEGSNRNRFINLVRDFDAGIGGSTSEEITYIRSTGNVVNGRPQE